jgi:thiol-disulfide isomerase/thioredoxin
MRRIAASLLLAMIALLFATITPCVVRAADAPQDRVVAMYFHRTERCPTCQKMGSYSEEAVKTAFAEELKKGQVAFHFIDFEDTKNARYTKAYNISGPALIVAKIADNKVASYKDLDEIWTKVRDKAAFVQYVQENVKAGLAN